MASIFKKTGSPFWYVKYRDDDTGLWKSRSTGIPLSDPESKRKAKAEAYKLSCAERSNSRVRQVERWQFWVPEYFDIRYGAESDGRNLTRIRARSAWASIAAYLAECKVATPRQMTYKVAAGYFEWRKARKRGGRCITHNTAVTELRFLSVAMREAVRRGYAEANCVRDVETRREAGKQKDAFTVEQLRRIEMELRRDETPEWMREHYLVLSRQGCRSSEAFVPMRNVDERNMTIRLLLKGGKEYTAPLHPDLLPLVAKAREEKRKFLINPVRYAPKQWHTFFRRIGMESSVHWLRVTVITRMLLQNYSTAQVCAWIGHSEEVQRVYRKIKPSELAPPTWTV